MRRRGTPEQVETARAALENLNRITWEDDEAQARRAENLGIPLRDFFEGPSEEYERANTAAGEALDNLSWWQEWRVRDKVDANDPHRGTWVDDIKFRVWLLFHPGSRPRRPGK